MCTVIFFAGVYSALTSKAIASTTLTSTTKISPILTSPHALKAFNKLNTQTDIARFRDYNLLAHDRDLLDLVIAIQALREGGYKDELVVRAVDNPEIALESVAKGEAVMSAISEWRLEVARQENKLWLSDAVIRKGEFEYGIYTCGTTMKADDFRQSLSNLVGTSDVRDQTATAVLNSLNVKKKNLSSQPVATVCGGAADFLLMPFPIDTTQTLTMDGHLLTPVHGLKVNAKATRHYLVSRVDSDGRRRFLQLQRGLRKLRVKGRIHQAYRKASVLHPHVENWSLLNP
ncbi:hypothetical protein [Marinibactrum halimedae]|uniref:Uncharacterized protein n=2 Tax=Marinibactrum halimedae TaxID=1444977 RepID=A0AA37T2X2_9GAMM|nr:hypothetical protein [Marinibactrum halimedae]GLS25553.1 hypothetical protein GCM10007877_12670 [Marinibactrum halimedae]